MLMGALCSDFPGACWGSADSASLTIKEPEVRGPEDTDIPPTHRGGGVGGDNLLYLSGWSLLPSSFFCDSGRNCCWPWAAAGTKTSTLTPCPWLVLLVLGLWNNVS